MTLHTLPAIELLLQFREVRLRTVQICRPLRPEDTVVQPIVDVSPPKWHLGHTTWFWEQFFLKDYLPGYQPFHPGYAFLFNSYYEGAGPRWQRAQRGNLTRPDLEEIYAYRAFVDSQMEKCLAENELNERARTILTLGLQHEEQHQELLFYDIKYILAHNPLFPAYREDRPDFPAVAGRSAGWLTVEAGIYPIGFEGEGFHFDNEEGRHRVFLEAFQVQDRLVTNGEYLAFIESGGYGDFRWWLQEGWASVNQNQVDSPLYWHFIDGQWHNATLHGLEPLRMEDPVAHVSYYEADAFARWKGMRLPTEFEWEVAARQYAAELPAQANFMESGAYRPLPAGAQNQLFGDLWEWTSSAYLPYPYFTAEEGLIGEYNGKFMVNQMVLRGGSCATPKGHIRPTYRNFFHPHLRWLFSGIRLAQYR